MNQHLTLYCHVSLKAANIFWVFEAKRAHRFGSFSASTALIRGSRADVISHSESAQKEI